MSRNMRTRSEAKRPPEIKPISSHKESTRRLPVPLQTADGERRKSSALQPEARLRTPKLKSPKRKGTVHTPGRDDVLCSQHFDSQVVVGWDCNSPDTLRGIKRISGSEQHDDVSDLVMRLIGEDGDDELFTKRSTPPLLGVWKEEQEDKLLDDSTVPQRLRRHKTRQRKRSGKDSSVTKDLLNKLSIALDKCNEDEDAVEERDNEPDTAETTKIHDISDDLFNSESNNNVEIKVTRTSSRLQEKKNNSRETEEKSDTLEKQLTDVLKEEKTLEVFEKVDAKNNELEDENWSDDELFEEDSFIVKATQLTCDTKKFVSPVFGVKRKTSVDNSTLPKSKCTRYTFQLGDDKDKMDCSDKKFTNVQHKPGLPTRPVGYSSTGDTGKVNTSNTKFQMPNTSAVTRSNSGIVTASSSLRSNITSSTACKPSVNSISSSHSSTICNKFYPKSAQVFNNAINGAKAGAQNAMNVPVTKQTSNIHIASHNYNYASSDAQLNSQSSSAFSNSSFRKHGSFSGSESSYVVSSRRRSISGDNFPNNTRQSASALTTSRNTSSSSSSVRSNATCMYPAAAAASSSRTTAVSSSSSTRSPAGSQTSASSSSVIYNSSRKPAAQNCDTTRKSPHCAISSRQSNCTISNAEKTSNNNKVTSSELTEKRGNERKALDRICSGGFDTSLSDDILCQLAEPDDLLDSQAMFNETVTPVRHVAVDKSRRALNTTSYVSSKPSVIGKPLNILPNASVGSKSSVTCNSRNVGISSGSSAKPVNLLPNTSIVSKSSVICNSQSVGLSAVNNKPPVKQYKFKQSQRKVTSPTGNKPNVSTEKSTIGVIGSSVKTKGPNLEQYSEDLFASDDDDDMLLADDDMLLADDDILTEPQILAMLDEVELMATQQHAAEKSSKASEPVPNQTDIKDSARQSIDKCMPTDHGTDLPGSQGEVRGSQDRLVENQPTGSQGQPTGSQGQPIGSQGQPMGSQGHSCSQTKYSPEEIERKKREAMERRKRRLKKV